MPDNFTCKCGSSATKWVTGNNDMKLELNILSYQGILQADESYKAPEPGQVTVNVPVSQAAQARAKWQEAMNSDVLIVRCREEVGEMHKNKLGSGGRGKCIKVGDEEML